MKQEDYVKERLQDQIDWYDRNSSANRKIYKTLRIIQVVSAALIPFLSGLILSIENYKMSGTVVVGVLGVIVTVATGVSSLGRHRENWIEYRRLCESLQREKYLFETEVGPYSGKKPFDLLVQNVEALLAKENTNWSQYMLKPEKTEESKSN